MHTPDILRFITLWTLFWKCKISVLGWEKSLEWELKQKEKMCFDVKESHLLRRCSVQLHSGGFIHTTLCRKEKLIITKEIMWKIPSWCFVFVEYEEYREQITSNKTPFDYVLWDWSRRAIRPFRGSYTLHYTLCVVSTHTQTHTPAVSVCVPVTIKTLNKHLQRAHASFDHKD